MLPWLWLGCCLQNQLSYSYSDIIHCILLSQSQVVEPAVLFTSLHRVYSQSTLLCYDYFMVINGETKIATTLIPYFWKWIIIIIISSSSSSSSISRSKLVVLVIQKSVNNYHQHKHLLISFNSNYVVTCLDHSLDNLGARLLWTLNIMTAILLYG